MFSCAGAQLLWGGRRSAVRSIKQVELNYPGRAATLRRRRLCRFNLERRRHWLRDRANMIGDPSRHRWGHRQRFMRAAEIGKRDIASDPPSGNRFLATIFGNRFSCRNRCSIGRSELSEATFSSHRADVQRVLMPLEYCQGFLKSLERFFGLERRNA